MAQIALHYTAAQIDEAIGKVQNLISVISDTIVQLYNGDQSHPIYPRTKAEAVFFDNDINNTLPKYLNNFNRPYYLQTCEDIRISIVDEVYLDNTNSYTDIKIQVRKLKSEILQVLLYSSSDSIIGLAQVDSDTFDFITSTSLKEKCLKILPYNNSGISGYIYFKDFGKFLAIDFATSSNNILDLNVVTNLDYCDNIRKYLSKKTMLSKIGSILNMIPNTDGRWFSKNSKSLIFEVEKGEKLQILSTVVRVLFCKNYPSINSPYDYKLINKGSINYITIDVPTGAKYVVVALNVNGDTTNYMPKSIIYKGVDIVNYYEKSLLEIVTLPESCKYFISNIEYQTKYVKELYLQGLSPSTKYYIRFSKSSQWFFQIFNSINFTTSTIVAQGQCGSSFSNRIISISEQNNSGIFGKVIINDSLYEYDEATTTIEEKTVCLNNEIVGDICNSPNIALSESSSKYIYTVNKNAAISSTNFHSLLECILVATSYLDSEIFVSDGDYDLVKEFEDYYGSDYFTNFNDSTTPGIVLKNRINIQFSSKANVTFNYTGDNVSVHKRFSPFNAGELGFTLTNLHLNASNCRYCIHDERSTDSDSYFNNYIGCNFYLDNSQNSDWASKQCIGGGFGINGYVKIEGCIFESVGISSSTLGIVSYHNSSSSLAKSNLIISNCYFAGQGTFRLSWYGNSPYITTVFVSNCSLGSSFIQRAETSSYDVHNTSLTEWNNIIRS